jgi:hypothetical protein
MRMQSPSSNDSIVKTRFLLPLFNNFLMFLEMADCIPTCDEVGSFRATCLPAHLNIRLTRHNSRTGD